ncbi:sugar ABC transporter permease [Brevibacillus dissolubilis]|uniref:sugar ABC transporter permease n=1 Tax=Brevibacillus dissolubilis TaxID=1844116 RepID=UPI001116A1AB|nr:sugar ABC transporter permease [Brevibacillus dissolubilis]
MKAELTKAPGTDKKLQLFGKPDMRTYTMIFALIAIWVLFTFLNDTFLTARNLSNLFMQMSVTSILAIGMVLIIVAGHIDLSVGSIVGLTGGVAAILQVWFGMDTGTVIVATLVLGALIGLLQGWIVAYQAVPAFIVTLGGMMVFRGILMGITDGTTVAPLTGMFKMVGNAYLPFAVGYGLAAIAIVWTVFSTLRKRQSRIKYGFDVPPFSAEVGKLVLLAVLIGLFAFVMNWYKGIPFPLVIVAGFALLFTFLANHTPFGRSIYAIGGNKEAARLSGINIKRNTLFIFVLSGLLSSIAAIVLTSRLDSATISAGQNYELDAIAACVIGGTSLMGGSGKIFGAIIGGLVMASLDNGMSLINLDSFWQYIVKGSILVLAVWVDIRSRRQKA